MEKQLRRNFFQRDTHTVARALLGKLLIRQWQGKKLQGRITEVESYVGEDDRACHAARGKTARTEVMWNEAGHAYVYLIYGVYDCLNIVTDRKNFPAAVLLRSLEPLTELKTMQRLRGTDDIYNLTTGPGKLTQAFAITRRFNKEDLATSQRLYVADDGYRVAKSMIAASPRIGVDYAGECAKWPWRYFIQDSKFISRK